MTCKKALDETDGDIDAAIDLLRKKGEAKAADRADRYTGNGVVVVKIGGGKAAILSLLCETDFVSRGEDFQNLAGELTEKLLSGEYSADSEEVPEAMKDAFIKLGEKIVVGGKKIVEGSTLGYYVHSNSRIGVVVSLEGGNEELAKDVAMHSAATNPSCISPEEVSDGTVAKEKEIWTEQLAREGKPAEIIEKIMMGKEKKFREENALVKQQFVKDPEKTIEQLLQEGGATVKEFVRLAV